MIHPTVTLTRYLFSTIIGKVGADKFNMEISLIMKIFSNMNYVVKHQVFFFPCIKGIKIYE